MVHVCEARVVCPVVEDHQTTFQIGCGRCHGGLRRTVVPVGRGGVFRVSSYSLISKTDSTLSPPSPCIHTICQVYAALRCIHGHQILHRDLTPANVLLVAGDTAKLADFGCAATFPVAWDAR